MSDQESKEVIKMSEIKFNSKIEGATDMYDLCLYLSETEDKTLFTVEDIEGYLEALIATYKEQQVKLVANELNNSN